MPRGSVRSPRDTGRLRFGVDEPPGPVRRPAATAAHPVRATRAAVAARARAGRPRRRDVSGGRPAETERGGGQRLTPKSPRKPEPAIADGVTGKELDRAVWTQLRTLSKENAEGVAQHLVMVGRCCSTPTWSGAQAHAETAVRRAGRVPAAREALGLVAYRQGDWAKALAEFRTVRRLSGSSHLLPLMVDAERALGRPDRALELASTPEARTLARDEQVELAIVVSGIRRDQGQLDAAAAGLQLPRARPAPPQGLERPAVLRLRRGSAGARRPRRRARVVRLRRRRGRGARDRRGRAGRRARRRRAGRPPRR